MALPNSSDLRSLLHHLSLEPAFRLPLNSLQSVEGDDSDQPSAVWLRETLEDHRRIVYKGRDFRQSGLFEFEVGLRLMERGRHPAAIDQFAMARRQWRFADDAALLALADLALGLARQYNYEYEGSLESYYRVEDYLADAEKPSASASQAHQERDSVQFVPEATQVLRSALSALNDSVRSASEAQPLYVAAVEPPIIGADLAGDDYADQAGAGLLLSFQISLPPTVKVLSEIVLPVLEAIEHIDTVLGLLLDSDRRLGARVRQSSSASPLELTVENILPQTADLCARVQDDRPFGDDLNKLLDNLGRTRGQQFEAQWTSVEPPAGSTARNQWRQIGGATTQAELAVQELCLQKALALLNNYAPMETPRREQLGLATQLCPALQVIARALADRQLSIEYSEQD